MRRTPIALASTILLACASIPAAIGYLIAPDDRRFMGIVSDVPDWAQYLAWMRAFAERIVIENPLTCEPQAAAFFNLQWLVLGRLALWFPLPLVLESFRVLTGACFLWLTWRIVREYFAADRRAAWTAWWLINVAAGWGWIWVVDKYLFGRADARNPMDIYIAEPITLQNMTIFPHFLVAAVLILLTFRAAARAFEEERWRPVWASGGCSVLLGITHGYDLIIIYGVLGVFFLAFVAQRGWSWFRCGALALIGLLSFPAPAYFAYLTSTDPIWRKVLSQFGDAGVFTPAPPHLLILVGLPLALTLATLPNVLAWRQPTAWRLMVRVWCVVNAFLLYVPLDFQVHMLSGWQIPLGLLATEGLYTRLWAPLQSRLARAMAGWPWLRFTPSTIGILVLVGLTLPTNVYLLAWRVREVMRIDHEHYLYRDELQVLDWLDRHGGDGDAVLASVTVGQFVPALSRRRPHAGHWAQTVDFSRRRREVSAFFNADTSDSERLAILRQCDTRYVLVGRAERLLGAFDASAASYLTPVFSAGDTALYRVAWPSRS